MIPDSASFWRSNPPTRAEERSAVVRCYFQLQISMSIDAARRIILLAASTIIIVVAQKCLQIKHSSGNLPGHHVSVGQCGFEVVSADVTVGQLSIIFLAKVYTMEFGLIWPLETRNVTWKVVTCYVII
jgi:hypothetical protein